jgi:hypothetical protein
LIDFTVHVFGNPPVPEVIFGCDHLGRHVARLHFKVMGFNSHMATPISNDVQHQFMSLVGRVVVTWGKLERTMDIAVTLGKHLVPSHVKKGKVPRQYADKVEALRSVCKSIPEFQNRIERTNRCLDEVLKLALDRNTIVHGQFHGISGEADPQIYFRNATPLTGEAGQRLLMTRREMTKFLDDIDRVAFELMWIMLGVMSACGGKGLGKPSFPRPPR